MPHRRRLCRLGAIRGRSRGAANAGQPARADRDDGQLFVPRCRGDRRSEEHTSELQSLMRISYAVFCLKKKKINKLSQYKQMSTSISLNNSRRTSSDL